MQEPKVFAVRLGERQYELLSDELENLKRISVRWSVLECLHRVLSETRFDIPDSIDSDLEVVRSIIETGCRKVENAKGLLNWVENRLIEKGISLDNFLYWEDMIWKAKDGKLSREEMLKIPYMDEVAKRYEFLSYCLPTALMNLQTHEKLIQSSEMLYTRKHMWAQKTSEGNVKVGIDGYAKKHLNGIADIHTKRVGAEVSKLEPFGTVETWLCSCLLYAPVSGKIVEVNEKMKNDPHLISDEEWIVEIEPKNSLVLEQELNEMLSSKQGKKLITNNIEPCLS